MTGDRPCLAPTCHTEDGGDITTQERLQPLLLLLLTAIQVQYLHVACVYTGEQSV